MLKPGSNDTSDPLAWIDESQLARLLVYPVDMTSLHMLAQVNNDVGSMPYVTDTHRGAAIIIIRYALALWNRYSSYHQESLRVAFLAQAYCLVEYEQRIGEDAGGWPLDFPSAPPHIGRHYLSALVQGQALCVLTRAYILTRETTYLEVARRAVRTFERDILDGGVNTPMAGSNIFFEQWAVYPAAHTLEGMVFALLGLHDFLALVDDADISTLIRRAHESLHRFLPEFEMGYWTRTDLLNRRLASNAQHERQVNLLQALSQAMCCEECAAVAARWKRHQQRSIPRLRSQVERRCAWVVRACWRPLQHLLFHNRPVRETPQGEPLRVCVPITAFPVTGGMRTVLAKVAHVTEGIWQLEYLTQYAGQPQNGFIIHQFGKASMSISQFPNIWLYTFAGFLKLVSLMRAGSGYRIIIPQDGICTAAFAAFAARMAGVRSVCIDHGNLGLLKSHIYRAERINSLTARSKLYRLQAYLRYLLYWPSLNLLARFAACFVDHFLIPGVENDGVEEMCKRLGVQSSRITRFANAIDVDRHIIPDAKSRTDMRKKNGIPADSIVITMICRLAPEKGLDIALEAISQAISTLSPDLRTQVRVIIAGDGPLRKQLEADIRMHELSQTCELWGEASEEAVISLLGISDIFLFTSRRAAGYPLAILEAMASGCAVIASSEPLANSHMLDEERGIVVPVEDTHQTAKALERLLNNPVLCNRMGRLARDYVEVRHSATSLRRALMRVTYWSSLDEFLKIESES